MDATGNLGIAEMEPRPVLKWAGGKCRMLPQLRPLLPARFSMYYEPFLGGGAMLFELGKDKVIHGVAGDKNVALVEFYRSISLYPTEVAEAALAFAKHHSEDAFRKARAVFNGLKSTEKTYSMALAIAQAGALLYLNKTCFNGLYRENKRGEFNVPPNVSARWSPDASLLARELGAAGRVFKRVSILSDPFDRVIAGAGSGDFIFADPPYLPAENASFTAYSADGFTADDHESLSAVLRSADSRGAQFMLTHSDHPFIRSLYKGFDIRPTLAHRSVGAAGKRRGKVPEIVIRNYARTPEEADQDVCSGSTENRHED